VQDTREDLLKTVRGLADGFSKQSKYSNQLWLASIAAAAVLVFPSGSNDTVNLPFSLATIPKTTFEPVGFGILFILVMAFCQAYAHAHNAAFFGQRQLDRIERIAPEIMARDIYDILVTASFARVWPLVDLLRKLPGPTKVAAIPYYVTLKLLTHVFMLGVPLLALARTYVRILEHSSPWVHVPILISLVLVVVAAIEIAVSEFLYAKRVVVGRLSNS